MHDAQITEAIRRYGVADTTTSLIVVRIGPSDLSNVEQSINAVVSGKLSPLEELSTITDWASVKKAINCRLTAHRMLINSNGQYYKLNNEPALKAVAKDPSRERSVIDEIVTSSVAMKSVMG